MDRHERSLLAHIIVVIVLVKHCASQAPMTCTLPCDSGYVCYQSRYRNREPECIRMSVYLSLVQGSTHGHTGPTVIGTQREPTHLPGGPPNHHNHRFPSVDNSGVLILDGHSSSHTHGQNINSRDRPGSGSHLFVDSNTRPRFGSDSSTMSHRPLVSGQRSITTQTTIHTGHRPRGSTPIKHVSAANPFEDQLPDRAPSIPQRISIPRRQRPTPVGPLTNNRDKSVLEIIEELARSKSSQSNRRVSSPSPRHDHNSNIDNNRGHTHTHGSEPLNTRREPLNTRREPINMRREPLNTRREPLNTRREPLNMRREPLNTRRERLNTRRDPTNTHVGHHHSQHTPETPDISRTQTGTNIRVSAIFRDESGYHYMFYSASVDEGIRVNISRTGFCSRSDQTQNKLCPIRCTSDNQCVPSHFKCCPTGCGLSCAPPRE